MAKTAVLVSGGGATLQALLDLCYFEELPGLEIKGLMAMMPLGAERDALLGYFSRMRALLDQCRQEAIPGTDMTELSMGMSQDYDLAARCGATMVRVGSALFR